MPMSSTLCQDFVSLYYVSLMKFHTSFKGSSCLVSNNPHFDQALKRLRISPRLPSAVSVRAPNSPEDEGTFS